MNKILNFGSLNIDMVYNMPHIVRPGETLSSLGLSYFCGGKGLNQSVALARAGGNVFHAGRVGKDGDMLIDVLKQNKINDIYVKEANGKSGHAIIQVEEKGQNCILLYGGENRLIDESMIDEVLCYFDKTDLLVCQNEISSMPYLIDKAAEKGMKIALNPSPIDETILSIDLKKITYLIINEIEGHDFTGENEPQKICEALLKKSPSLTVVLTIGKDGAIYSTKSEQFSHGIFPVPVVDTTAAGDTFLGFFLAGVITVGKSPYEALRLASGASSLAVSKKGATPSIPTLKEVEEFLSHNA